MHASISRGAMAVAVAAALSAPGAAGAAASGSTIRAPAGMPTMRTSHAAVSPHGTQLWLKRYNGPANGPDHAESVVVSPRGDRVFVTGQSSAGEDPDGTPKYDYLTVAYNAVTGAGLWLKRYNGPANGTDSAESVAISPAGDRVFVTGRSDGPDLDAHYTTIAYNAATGAPLWVTRSLSRGTPRAVGVSPNGAEVFVTGTMAPVGSAWDYLTVAYNAATGAQLWARRYNGPINQEDDASAMAVSPTGDRVFVTGSSYTTPYDTKYDYATVAYNALTGAQLWVKRYNDSAGEDDYARSVAVSPGGDRVFVTGDPATLAYNAATGAVLWLKPYKGGGSVAVSPAGDGVFVTGEDPVAVAYDPVTGAQLWAKPYSGSFYATSVAVSPAVARVFVAGESPGATPEDYGDYAVIAYNAATGTRLWANRYNGPANGFDEVNSIAVSPGSDKVFVTGASPGADSAEDYATIAYQG
jgi:PQQ-like domain